MFSGEGFKMEPQSEDEMLDNLIGYLQEREFRKQSKSVETYQSATGGSGIQQQQVLYAADSDSDDEEEVQYSSVIFCLERMRLIRDRF